ncbi:Uncharacterized membrane protein [Microbulbifer donghaiensis]|uniref:Uncharacterized membrane protein n=1 Tax=Microbulbifer donghaiensis TaxID=494016 RepID=A0A1M5DWI1_9GAMM|nr:DUF2061 domain-containing protein [Microbulbifer donghaiensis]SHF71286.1 Uncharacterized membrane protein [Microbulbifer donghaiensis]
MLKTVSFAIVHMAVAFSVGFLMTGDLLVGSALALVEPLCNTVAYYFHEKVWKRVESRRRAERNSNRYAELLHA